MTDTTQAVGEVLKTDVRGRMRVSPERRQSPLAEYEQKFHEALEPSPQTAGWMMRQIQHFYRVEAKLREQ